MSPANRDNFTSLHFRCLCFFFLSIALARTSSTVLNRTGKVGIYPCLVHDQLIFSLNNCVLLSYCWIIHPSSPCPPIYNAVFVIWRIPICVLGKSSMNRACVIWPLCTCSSSFLAFPSHGPQILCCLYFLQDISYSFFHSFIFYVLSHICDFVQAVLFCFDPSFPTCLYGILLPVHSSGLFMNCALHSLRRK